MECVPVGWHSIAVTCDMECVPVVWHSTAVTCGMECTCWLAQYSCDMHCVPVGWHSTAVTWSVCLLVDTVQLWLGVSACWLAQYSCDMWHRVCACWLTQYSCDMQYVPVVWHSTAVLYVRQHSSEPVTLSLDLLSLAIELAPSECLTKVDPSNWLSPWQWLATVHSLQVILNSSVRCSSLWTVDKCLTFFRIWSHFLPNFTRHNQNTVKITFSSCLPFLMFHIGNC